MAARTNRVLHKMTLVLGRRAASRNEYSQRRRSGRTRMAIRKSNTPDRTTARNGTVWDERLSGMSVVKKLSSQRP